MEPQMESDVNYTQPERMHRRNTDTQTHTSKTPTMETPKHSGPRQGGGQFRPHDLGNFRHKAGRSRSPHHQRRRDSPQTEAVGGGPGQDGGCSRAPWPVRGPARGLCPPSLHPRPRARCQTRTHSSPPGPRPARPEPSPAGPAPRG